jgi:hypothetical protein
LQVLTINYFWFDAGKQLPARLGQTSRQMTYDFLADKQTKIDILEFIFRDTDLRVFDLGSSYGQEICEYKSVDEVTKKFDLVNGDKFAVTFQLWSPRFKGDVLFRKVTLDPKYCNGHTFRYSTDGWGLIQLYFGGIKHDKLNQSHIGHFTEKAALDKESATTFNGKVSNWDWTEIQKTSRTLKQKIQNLLTAKQN